ncbi:YegS/Rv2252/BmrU family lipid kinase [Alkalibaculum bacchi]|uniref:YegS/Rv2252/BmrU family lipid kinase n=1 Tax=Alkalibaculum bacchi TaxID=645887 RepID=UPI0026EEFDC0|nr:YegS/Rv2252/BmrU family lipid kinase [Alkalibaculum bacchi]
MDKRFVFLLYNPVAGNKSFPNHLDYFIEVFQNKGYEVHLFRTSCVEDFSNVFENRDVSIYEAIFIAGGDGSVNALVNSMIKLNIDISLGIIPAGTMNDICYNIGMSMDIRQAIESLSVLQTEYVDVGLVNNQCFLNVCGGGLFMEISQNTDRQLKNVMGRVAYYITGIQQLPNFKKLKLRISTEEQVIEDEFYFFIVMNGRGAGGFHKLAPEAMMNDGKLDLIAIKVCPLNELSVVFAKILRGTHLSYKNIIHIQSNCFLIENIEEDYNVTTDIDGEEGPSMPLDLRIFPRKLKMILPPKD